MYHNKYCVLPIESLLVFSNTHKYNYDSYAPGVAAADCINTSSSLHSVVDAARVQPASSNSLCYSSPGMKPGDCDDGEGIKRNRPRYYHFSLQYSSCCPDNDNNSKTIKIGYKYLQ